MKNSYLITAPFLSLEAFARSPKVESGIRPLVEALQATVTPLCPARAPATRKRKLTDAGVLEAADLVVKALRPTAKDLFNTTNTRFQNIEREIEKVLN